MRRVAVAMVMRYQVSDAALVVEHRSQTVTLAI
jgi:hypothetical protein